MFGRGMIKKVLMYLILGPLGLLFGGRFNIMDLLLIPMVAGVFAPLLGSLTGGNGILGTGKTVTPGVTT